MNHPHTGMSLNERELANKSGRKLQSMGPHGDSMDRLRLLCLSRGATGILHVGRMFRRMEDEGNRNLNWHEFTRGLRGAGLDINDEEAKNVFQLFDSNDDGTININEFLVELRPPMCDSRKWVIEKCFKKLDKNEDGYLTMDHLKGVYNVKDNPRYISGEDDEETLLKRFMANFKDDYTTDEIVTKEDFLNYYAGISASVENDCFFDLMLRHTYKL